MTKNPATNSNLPFVSFVIPTYNSQKYIDKCLASISIQDYPRDKFEVIIVDGGSTDATLSIAKKYSAIILPNPAVDAEEGKAIGIKRAKGEVIALVDSDNELAGKNWLLEMVKPLTDDERIFGVESIWKLNKQDSIINQYCTLIKVSDPFARFLSSAPKKYYETESYTVIEILSFESPIIGANGFLWRKKFVFHFGRNFKKFEEVNFASQLLQCGFTHYAISKTSGTYHDHVHSIKDFVYKRIKIGNKFLKRKAEGRKTWVDYSGVLKFLIAFLYCATFFVPAMEAIYRAVKDNNIAWLLHPFMCFITLSVYVFLSIQFALNILFPRKNAVSWRALRILRR
ncbi:MAG: glycosyltransferase family 2 protein [Candidatus Omnitrophica bacterium]|nr:glycosyltransferase family 2 protein [Candidatus Omnitrophota bacterium]